MPVSFTLNRVTNFRPLTGDQDGDGYADAGDVLRHTLTIHNTGDTDALNVVLNDLLGGSTETGLMNISPIAFNDAFTAVGNTALRVGGAANIGTGPSSVVAGNLLANDVGSTTVGVGALAADDVTGFTIDTVTNQLTAGGGRFSIFADGSFNYISEAGDQGTDSFTYTIRDAGIDGVAGNSDDTTSTATVTITITGQVWYVDSAAAGGGTGTSANPFNSITALNTANVDGANDYVYVKGNAAGQLVMETGEHLIGQGADLDVAGFHLADDGARSTITNSAAGFGVTLAGGGTGNNEIAGINIVATGGAGNHALTGTSFGNLTINNTTIDASGQALVLSTGGIVAGSTGLVSTDSDGGTNNVSLTTVTGTLALGTGALSGATGTAFNVSGGSVSTTYSGNVSQASASQALVSVAGGHTGTLTFSTGTLSATNGTGLQFDNGDGAYNFNGTNTLNGGDAGVDIVNGSGGAFSFSTNSSITNATGIAFNVNGGGGNIDYNGTITHTANTRAISVQNHTGGTVSFDGTVSATGSSDGILLATNTGTIINFTNTLTINAAGANFQASGGGTITATGAGSTISSGTATSLSVVSTNIGLAGLTFTSLTSSGAVNGILLNATGTTAGVHGGLTVTGDGGSVNNSSGGTITNATGAGISITDARAISIDQINIQNSANDGIDATRVTNFALTNSTIAGAGDGANEFGIFLTDLFGTGTINNVSSTNSQTNNLRIQNDSTTAGTVTITNSTFTTTDAANGGDAVSVITNNSANLTVILADNNDLNNSQGDGIQGSANNSSTLRITVDGSNSNYNGNLGSAVNIAAANSAHIYALVQDFTGVSTGTSSANGLNVINIQNFDTSIIEATVQNNTITGLGNNASGIRVIQEGNGTITADLFNNSISGLNANGILAQARAGTGQLNLTVHNNTVSLTSGLSLDGMSFESGSSAGGDTNTLRLDLFSNNSTATSNQGYRLRIRSGTNFILEDFTGNGASTADVTAWINNAPKSNVGNTDIVIGAPATFGTIADVPMPTLPLLAASAPEPEPPLPDPVKSDGGGTGGELPPPTGDPAPPPAAGGEPPIVVDDGILSQAELNLILNAAIDRWAAAGATAEQIAAMRAVTLSVEDLSGLSLGASTAGHITIDTNAAGFSWFIDATPGEDSEYSGSGTRLTAAPDSQAGVRIDLLTTIMHELGHQVGLSDDYNAADRDELMFAMINPGERRLPGNDDLTGSSTTPLTGTAFALSPVSLGTIPAGRTVTVQWDSTVNAFTNQIVPTFNNTSSVSGSNFVTATSNTEVLGPSSAPIALDSLTLGNLVFFDQNHNGTFDGADTGINGVALTLFADTNANGVFDSGIDVQIATATTAGGGLYSFANLAPGDYIVRVDAANFTGGGALVGRLTATGGSDPDDNVNNDDNGVNGAGGIVVSQAITLVQSGETTADVTGKLDINNTLDFGFIHLNEAPINTVPGTQTINEDATLTFTGGSAISVNDTDVAGGNLTVTLSVVNGQLTLSGTAGLTFALGGGDGTDDTSMTFSGTQAAVNAALSGLLYETTSDYNGSDTLTITTNDNGNTGADPGLTGGANDEQDTDTVTINITAVADIANDTPTVGEDSGANNLTLLANDSFENPGRSITSVTQGLHGFVSINDNNTVGNTTDDFVVYTPAADYNGADSFTYTVTSGGVTETATANVTVTAVADIANDAATVGEDSGATTIDVIANDSFENGGFFISTVTQGLHGTVTIIDGPDADANPDYVTYTPNADYNGLDSFTYTVTSGGVTETATVNVTVTAVADIADDTVGVIQDSGTNNLNLLANDTFESAGRAITAVGAALHGTTAINNNATPLNATDDFVTYSPTGGYSGPDTFTYTVTSGGVTETATVTVNVAPPNQAPVVDLNDGTAGINDTNLYVEGGSASGIGVSIAVSDADAGDNIESATITITDPETGDILTVSLPLPPGIAVDTVNSTDTTLILIGSATPSAYAGALGQVGYSSTSNDPTDGGTNSNRVITVVVNDGTANSAAATMTMTVADVNDEPTLAATGLNPTYTENGAAVDLFSGVTVTGPEGGQALTSLTLTVTNVTDGANEILSFDGSNVALTNGNAVTTATNGLAVNVAVSGGTATVSFSGASLTPAQVQTLVDAMTYRNASENPTDANRVVTITELVDNGSNVSPADNIATLSVASTVNVNPVDDAPVAQPDYLTTDPVTPVSGNLFVNNGSGADTDIDGPALSVAEVNGSAGNVGGPITLASGGQLSVSADGNFTYTPPAITSGTDTFTYKLTGGTGTVTVTLGINLTIVGTPNPDVLTTGAGNDHIDGLGSADTMTGDIGNDTYIVDNLGDVVVEGAAGGLDTIFASVNYVLGAGVYVEALSSSNQGGTGAQNLTGNELANAIYGNFGDNLLDGGAGADILLGLTGSDTYYVDDAADYVIESPGSGTDIVYASVSYALGSGQEIEGLSARDAAATDPLTLVGNGFAQTITGNAGANLLIGGGGGDVLQGLGGDDVYQVTSSDDSVVELAGGGHDVVYTTVNYALSANVEILTADQGSNAPIQLRSDIGGILIGNGGNNDFVGNPAIAIGGAGDDRYFVTSDSRILEANGGGTDIAIILSAGVAPASPVEFHLEAGSFVETLVPEFLIGTRAYNIFGNETDNVIYGNDGANTLDGGGGSDILLGRAGVDSLNGGGGADQLNGGSGQDTLTGGAGADIFVFSDAETGDTITDFQGGVDQVDIHALISQTDFAFIGSGAFTGHAGDVRFAGGQLQGDMDGNGVADFVITIQGDPITGASDFHF